MQSSPAENFHGAKRQTAGRRGVGGGVCSKRLQLKKSNKRRACATWAKIPRDVKTTAMMRGVNHFGAALMDGKAAAECAGSSRSDGDACIRRSQLALAVAGGALRPARVVLNAGGEWGDLSAHNVLPRAPWKTTADRRGAGK